MRSGRDIDAMNVVDQRGAVALGFGERFGQSPESLRIPHGDAGVEGERAQYGNFPLGKFAAVAVGDEQDALQLVFRQDREAG